MMCEEYREWFKDPDDEGEPPEDHLKVCGSCGVWVAVRTWGVHESFNRAMGIVVEPAAGCATSFMVLEEEVPDEEQRAAALEHRERCTYCLAEKRMFQHLGELHEAWKRRRNEIS